MTRPPRRRTRASKKEALSAPDDIESQLECRISCLPDELLAPAFLMSLPESELLDSDAVSWVPIFGKTSYTPSTMDPPFPFMLVCKWWHDVVLSNPSLWSTFIVANYSHITDDDVIHIPALLDIYLRRSRNKPLTLVLALSTPPTTFHNISLFTVNLASDINLVNLSLELLHKAMEHRHRWQTFFANLGSGIFCAKLPEILSPSDMPMLADLAGWE